jgi:ABC-type transport system involved in multi-copper enzyme maturation permease subunit
MGFITLFQFLILYLVTTFDTAAILSAILDQLPPMMRVFLNDSFFSMLNYDGAAAFGLNHPIVLTLLVITAINIPAHHISRELESGTLELLLAHPVRRKTLLFSLWISGSLIIMIIIATALIGSCTSIILFHELTGSIFIHLLEICLNLWLLITLIFTYTLLIAVFGKTGSRPGNTSAGITFFFYLLFFLAQLWSMISFTNYFNIFNYYQPQKLMLGQGNFLRDILVLSVLILVCFGISLKQFNNRDLP